MAKRSALGNLVPLIIVVILLAVIGVVGFIAYTIANDVGKSTKKKLEKKNISFSKEGAKVGVKEKSSEEQQDDAQGVIVKIWNGFMDGNKGSTPSGSPMPTPSTEKRKPFSRSSSSQNNISRTSPNPTVARTSSSQNVR